jgi:uncharacterized DUF497 family protein
VEFEWDPEKAAGNVRRHRVSFNEAATVLDDPLSTTFPDEAHSEGEMRFVTVGVSQRGRLLVVAHTERNDTIRIISARRATRRERELYEQGN